MPPIGPEAYTGIHRNEAMVALQEREARLREQTYNRMKEIANQPRLRIAKYPFSGGERFETPKAVYQTDNQPGDEFTRAWASFSLGQAWLSTDRLRVTKDGVDVDEQTQVHHFGLSLIWKDQPGKEITGYNLTTWEHYKDFDTEQFIDLWAQVNDTLDLVQVATLATGDQRVAPYPEEPWPTLEIPQTASL